MKSKLICVALATVVSFQAYSADLVNSRSVSFDDVSVLQGQVVNANHDLTMESLNGAQDVNCSIKSSLWPSVMNKPMEQYYAELDVYRQSFILKKNQQYQVVDVKTKYYRTDISIDLFQLMNPIPDTSDMQHRAYVDIKLVDADKTEIEISCQGFSEDYGLKSTAFSKVKNAINYIFSK